VARHRAPARGLAIVTVCAKRVFKVSNGPKADGVSFDAARTACQWST
jgi:hypothetical protein